MQQEFSKLNIDMDAMGDQQQTTTQNQQTLTAEKARKMLCPTSFDAKNMQELRQIHLGEIDEKEAEIIDLKDNFLPAGLTPLEDIFDANDVPKKPKYSLKILQLKTVILEQ